MARAQGAAKTLRDNLTTLEYIAQNGFGGICGNWAAIESLQQRVAELSSL